MIKFWAPCTVILSAMMNSACEKPVAPLVSASKPADTPASESASTPPPLVLPPASNPASVAAPSVTPAIEAATPLVYPAPVVAQAKSPPANKTRIANFAGLEADIPLSWKPVPPANSMRLAEFEAPVDGQANAEAVVFYFPQGQGGPKDMNIARWASQFTDAGGNPVKPIINDAIINNMAVTRIELSGNYARGVGMGNAHGNAKSNQTLLAAIITTPAQGNVTFHLFGTQSSVKKQRENFEAVLRSIRFKG